MHLALLRRNPDITVVAGKNSRLEVTNSLQGYGESQTADMTQVLSTVVCHTP